MIKDSFKRNCINQACSRLSSVIGLILLHTLFLQMSVVYTIMQLDIDWKRECWLDTDIYQSGINPKLLEGYERDIPMTLYKNHELYYEILETKHNPQTLLRLSRILIRKFLNNKLHMKVVALEIPARLKDFLMLKWL